MITCSKCGGKNQPGGLFCQHCGWRLVNPTNVQIHPFQQSQQQTIQQAKRPNKQRSRALNITMGVVMLCLCSFISLMIFNTAGEDENKTAGVQKEGAAADPTQKVIPKTGPQVNPSKADTAVASADNSDDNTPKVSPPAISKNNKTKVTPTVRPEEKKPEILPSEIPTLVPLSTLNIPAAPMFTDWLFKEGQLVGIRDLAWNTKLGMTVPEQGRIYLSIYIITKNTGSGEKDFFVDDFEIVDGGNEVNRSVLFGNLEPGFNTCTIGPGGICEGWWTTMIWDRPEARQNLRLRWKPSWFASGMETPIFPESVSTNRIAIPISNSSVGSEANNLTCEQILQYQNQLSDVQFDEFLKSLRTGRFPVGRLRLMK